MLDDLKKTLWATADKLRANMDAAEYKHLVLGLIFVKYISDTFSARQAELTRRFADPADEYFLPDSTEAQQHAELEDRDYYRAARVFWVPEDARWEALRSAAKQPDIGKRIDTTLSLIELESPKLNSEGRGPLVQAESAHPARLAPSECWAARGLLYRVFGFRANPGIVKGGRVLLLCRRAVSEKTSPVGDWNVKQSSASQA